MVGSLLALWWFVGPAFAAVESFLEKGQTELDERKFAAALATFEKGIQEDATSVKAKLGKCHALLALNRNDAALPLVQEILKGDSQNADAHYCLGLIYEADNKIKEAVDEFFSATFFDKKHNEAHKELGLLWHRQKNDGQAIRHLETYLQAKPDDATIRVAHCQCAIELRNYELALKDAEMLIEKFPQQPYFISLKAVCLGDMKRFEEALGLHKQALTMKDATSNPLIFRNYAHTLVKAKKTRDACEVLAAGIKAGDTTQGTYSKLGRLLWLTDQKGEAVTAMRNAFQKAPNSISERCGYASFLSLNPQRTHEDLVEAKNIMEEYYRVSKQKNISESLALALVCSELGEFDEAVKYQEEAISNAGEMFGKVLSNFKCKFGR
jgi:tetratricopeptide (TPR) repeat protein